MVSERQFISSFNLIQLFTAPNEQGKYLEVSDWTNWDRENFPGCMKPAEFFENDIRQNLVEWAVTGDHTVWYRTARYWYIFERKTEQGCDLIMMTRFHRGAYKRWDSWMNFSSGTSVGKDWLMQEPQKSKGVKWSN